MNFDQVIDRNEFPTFKWDSRFLKKHYGSAEALPFSVADMDFPAPPAVIATLQGNIDFMQNYLAAHLPQVKITDPQGTYLLWIDFTALDLDVKTLEQLLGHEARLAVNPGYWFGREGAGFVRWNIACPRSLLQEALSRLRRAIEQLTEQAA